MSKPDLSRWVGKSQTQDGHPKRGGFLPPVHLPRRTWAGGAVTFHAPMHFEQGLTQLSRITCVDAKSEMMGFVTVADEGNASETLAMHGDAVAKGCHQGQHATVASKDNA